MDERRRLETVGWAIAAIVVVLLGARLLTGGGADAAPVEVAGPGVEKRRGGERGKRRVVDVDGEVSRPGLVRVRPGARIGDAVRAAGGLTRRADGSTVNLAAPVQDGQQVVVPRRGAGPAAVAAGPGQEEGGAPGAPISLATAGVAELDTIDGIGPTLAQRIVDYREEHGGFRSIEELQEVEGIGEARFEALRAALQP
jgi:competence protein ComEA